MVHIAYNKGKIATSTSYKLTVAMACGLLAGLAVGAQSKWQFALLTSWDVATLAYLVWTWLIIGTVILAATVNLVAGLGN